MKKSEKYKVVGRYVYLMLESTSTSVGVEMKVELPVEGAPE